MDEKELELKRLCDTLEAVYTALGHPPNDPSCAPKWFNKFEYLSDYLRHLVKLNECANVLIKYGAVEFDDECKICEQFLEAVKKLND